MKQQRERSCLIFSRFGQGSLQVAQVRAGVGVERMSRRCATTLTSQFRDLGVSSVTGRAPAWARKGRNREPARSNVNRTLVRFAAQRRSHRRRRLTAPSGRSAGSKRSPVLPRRHLERRRSPDCVANENCLADSRQLLPSLSNRRFQMVIHYPRKKSSTHKRGDPSSVFSEWKDYLYRVYSSLMCIHLQKSGCRL